MNDNSMLRGIVRGVLGLVFAALATWAANAIVERMFGPDPGNEQLA
ncbi:MAG: hypothetical protein ACR2J8_03040 [Thermomicrobiales bacterium]